MKKNDQRKHTLRLGHETVRTLSSIALPRVVGGAYTAQTNCGQAFCGTNDTSAQCTQ